MILRVQMANLSSASRLDRLFVLLETGSTSVTRFAAARQLGEVQRLHPHELSTLLSRISHYLKATSWETRIAAAEAVRAIVTNVPQPPDHDSSIEELNDGTPPTDGATHFADEVLLCDGRLCFKTFDITNVLQHSFSFTASEGTEFDSVLADDDATSPSPDIVNKRLAHQRLQLNKHLGLNSGLMGGDDSLLVTNEDLLPHTHTKEVLANDESSMQHISKTSINEVLNMSSREVNRAKRKARLGVSAVNKLPNDTRIVNNLEEASAAKRSKRCDTGTVENRNDASLVSDNKQPHPSQVSSADGDDDKVSTSQMMWNSLNWFSDHLCQQLFHSNWESRHGAGTALRELISVHGKWGGTWTERVSSKQSRINANHLWLEDVCIRLLCVLALDRFGDFVSDAVVAPVRETCAQTLSVCMRLMRPDQCKLVMQILVQLVEWREGDWSCRHGGLLGIKYVLGTARRDIIPVLIPLSINAAVRSLEDEVDDVAAVAASALVPVAADLGPPLVESRALEELVGTLWRLLDQQDDELASACSSLMTLLAKLLTENDLVVRMQWWTDLNTNATQLPRLWPYLTHNSSSVRKATLQTIRTLIGNKWIGDANTSNDIVRQSPVRWDPKLLQCLLRHIFERVLVESNAEVRQQAEDVWHQLVNDGSNTDLGDLLNAACPMVSMWLCMCMHPSRTTFSEMHGLLTMAANLERCSTKIGVNNKNCNSVQPISLPTLKLYIGGGENVSVLQRENSVMQIRCMLCRMLGNLACQVIQPVPGLDYNNIQETPIQCFENVLLAHLNTKSALQRMVVGLVVSEWLSYMGNRTMTCPQRLCERLYVCLTELIYFDEIAHSFTRLTQEARDYIATLKHYNVPVSLNKKQTEEEFVYTLENMQRLVDLDPSSTTKLKPKLSKLLKERRASVRSVVQETMDELKQLNVACLAPLAGAIVMLGELPDKLTPVIKPLMESIRCERDDCIQMLSAKWVTRLLQQARFREPCPNDKIVTNLCTLLHSDPNFTPVIENDDKAIHEKNFNNYNGIVWLEQHQKIAERVSSKRANGRGPGRPSLRDVDASVSSLDVPSDGISASKESDENQKASLSLEIQRRGATMALTSIVKSFGPHLKEQIPKLWDYMLREEILSQVDSVDKLDTSRYLHNHADAERLLWSLQVLEVCYPYLDSQLRNEALDATLTRLCALLSHPYKAVRHLAARCLAQQALVNSVPVLEKLVDLVVPRLESMDDDCERQGAIEAISCIIDHLQYNIVPYVVLLIVPLLGRMSDPNENVRLLSTNTFATLVQLMPLDGAIPEPPAMTSSHLHVRRHQERTFLTQLLSPHTIPDCRIPIPISVSLRNYQQAGVNWLAFLNKYKLHGILCDDMGLGKTLQSICILAVDHYQREQLNKQAPELYPQMRSLVICPPTLIDHWVHEMSKFLSYEGQPPYLRALQYNGTPTEREKLRVQFKDYQVIVASYDIMRKDVDVFSSIKWNYVILDEGHIIKNGKTRTTLAVKRLTANHRLILSGTPIQNNVLELWSLFDFLMPGFLGTEKQFTVRYSRPILASRDVKGVGTSTNNVPKEAGVLAMESLHRQVLPFLLRRVKEDVLDDLPPKITQDYYCELSPLQERLYEDFAKSKAHQTLQQSLATGNTAATASSMQGNTHIFQALRYLQNVCNHPKLVLNAQHPLLADVMAELKRKQLGLDDIEHAAKLPALCQLLQDCGIGSNSTKSTSTAGSTSTQSTAVPTTNMLVINQHRALIFCQLKAMLDIVEKDLLQKRMPSVTYLRLDGSIPTSQRHSIVQTFNSDPSIDVLLLTTQIGGLGLNLTGADTVIFVEHDWNPMKDLQAMDRAHRIGQRKVVNVYRLITRNTLEEKIMGLQKFKVQTVNTVISSNNSKLETMGTDQLLDLFSHKSVNNSTTTSAGNTPNSSGGGSSNVRAILEALPDLWEQKQYDEEYDLTQFVAKLNG